jgi:uncharacterized protein YodC (DUF2158 family)
MSNELKIDDGVVLKSGGPNMTITSIDKHDMAICEYFLLNNTPNGSFWEHGTPVSVHVDALVKACPAANTVVSSAWATNSMPGVVSSTSDYTITSSKVILPEPKKTPPMPKCKEAKK